MNQIDKILFELFLITNNSKLLSYDQYKNCIRLHESDSDRQFELFAWLITEPSPSNPYVNMIDIKTDEDDMLDIGIDYYELSFRGLWRAYTKGVLKLNDSYQ